MNPFQILQLHQFSAGAALTGVAPNGTDSVQTHLRGHYRIWSACTDGGLFGQEQADTIHDSPPGKIMKVLWNLPGISNMIFSWVDFQTVPVSIPFWPDTGTASTVRGSFNLSQSLQVVPAGALKIEGTGNLSGPGSILVQWEGDLNTDAMKDIGIFGQQALPSLLG